jgi:PTS system nitrogen regulatory IIA component
MATGQPVFAPQAIALDVEAQGKIALLEAAAQLLKGCCGIEAEPAFRALYRRERAGTTAVGDGLAIPHARIYGIDVPVTLYLRTRTALRFGASDGKPVSEFFVIVVPVGGAPETQLALLREVAERFSQPAFRTLLSAASSATDVAAVFARWSEPQDDSIASLQGIS